ncbi:glycoside hydrolase family 3 N-terminal domain-containing protein [Gimibacter soli]|uniref:beta-glucosidase n=1 Tax=Gimibacter soli TaxID=3024400 RepID=A0AAF0BMB0_9PROT|nr:glycoside hydrolase family 3 N-terminal domain-containing protein [Gimibacter soli]WCL55292.1 glycoside hydrolase family 3 N-terminal domain-containing protein [Gimibacter soli]
MHIRMNQFLMGTSIALALGVAAPALTGAASVWFEGTAVAADLPVYKDATASVEARVEDLLARMTLEEKIVQMTTVWDGKVKFVGAKGEVDLAKLKATHPLGIGQYARPSDVAGAVSPRVAKRLDARGTVALVNKLQKYMVEETRLGIPMLFHEEGLHGYAAVDATSFPQAIGLASSWDIDLIREVNELTALEMRARGAHLALSPVVDIARDPRWGRFEETFGEDPYLVGEMGVAAVEGLQGTNRARTLAPGKVFATLKHLTGHGQPESGTNIGPAPVSERELRENFFPPFEEVVTRTGIEAVMPSYNEIDGVPSHANTWLLHDVLRVEWGFKGAIVSDYVAIDQMASIHHVAPDIESAAVLALKAGVDSDLPDGTSYATLPEALKDGKVTMAMIDDAVRRMLSVKFRAGLFENPYANADEAEAVANNAEGVALARKAAERSLILLKNDGTLPLKLGKSKPTVAVIGPSAAVARLGGYYGEPRNPVSLLDGMKARLGDSVRVVFAEGVKITENDDWWADEVKLADPAENRKRIAEAVKVAKGADQIVLTLGDTEQTSREAWADSHLGDRASLDLVGEQQELFDALKKLGKPITVVLINGRPASTVKIAEEANAIIEAWYPGEQGGPALAAVLMGDVNPGGKLPVTLPRSVGQLPMFYNHKPTAHRGYLFDTVDPLYPFGYGLSYTTFDLSEPRLSAASIATDGNVTVSVDVTNTGKVAGDEVVQLYIRDKVSSVTQPVKELKGFKRVTLKPGEKQTVELTLTPKSFRLWNDKMERVVEAGEIDIMTGANSVDLKTVTLTITN